jgi:hypothetical protein
MFPARFSLLPGRISRLNLSLFVLAVSILLPLAERSSAQIIVGGSSPISIAGSNNGIGISASSMVSVDASELPSAQVINCSSGFAASGACGVSIDGFSSNSFIVTH